jgi:hypothetical protein
MNLVGHGLSLTTLWAGGMEPINPVHTGCGRQRVNWRKISPLQGRKWQMYAPNNILTHGHYYCVKDTPTIFEMPRPMFSLLPSCLYKTMGLIMPL